MVADISQGTPQPIKDEAFKLLDDLGNPIHAIPFYALFPADGGAPIMIGDAQLGQATLIRRLEDALSKRVSDSGTAAPQR